MLSQLHVRQESDKSVASAVGRGSTNTPEPGEAHKVENSWVACEAGKK